MIEVLYKDLSFNFNNTNYTILKITCSRWAIFISETTNCLNQTLHVSSGSDSGWGEYVIKQNDPGLSQVLYLIVQEHVIFFFFVFSSTIRNP